MKRNLMILTVLALAASSVAVAGSGTVYGDGVTLNEAVAIETVLANPNDYVGKKVRVDGIITGVCKSRGCWMQVSDENGRGLRVKVEDGVIVFPATSMGHRASAEGIFEAIPVKAEHAAHVEKADGGCDKATNAAAKGGCDKAKTASAKGGCDKEKAAAESKSGCSKSKVAKAEAHTDCAKSKAAGSKDAGCDAKAEGKFVYLVRGTGAVIQS